MTTPDEVNARFRDMMEKQTAAETRRRLFMKVLLAILLFIVAIGGIYWQVSESIKNYKDRKEGNKLELKQAELMKEIHTLHKKNAVSEHRIDSLEALTSILIKNVQTQSTRIDHFKTKRNESSAVINNMGNDELYKFFSDFKTAD